MPVWEAIYVTQIASKTGWSEEFILHQLPLSRGMAYYHAVRLMEGERCRWPGEVSAAAAYVENAMQWAKKIWKRHTTQR